jgi:hypothetical protein
MVVAPGSKRILPSTGNGRTFYAVSATDAGGADGGGALLGDAPVAAEVLVTAASVPLLFFGLGMLAAHTAGKPRGSVALAGVLLLTGAIGAYTARQLMKRRLRPRGAVGTSSAPSFSNRSGSSGPHASAPRVREGFR